MKKLDDDSIDVLDQFLSYVYGFYCKGGIYDMNATFQQVEEAFSDLVKTGHKIEFD